MSKRGKARSMGWGCVKGDGGMREMRGGGGGGEKVGRKKVE